MDLFSKKLDVITVMAVVLIAISISVLDFNNLSWSNNLKSYAGIIISIILIIYKFIIIKNLNKK